MTLKIGLFGNPNTGKSSLFNMLTGLNQHVGNFPGVTVEKKYGVIKRSEKTFTIIDFPGIIHYIQQVRTNRWCTMS